MAILVHCSCLPRKQQHDLVMTLRPQRQCVSGTGSSGFSAQPMIPAHRKAVPVREKVGPSKALRTSEASLTSLQQTLNSRLMNDSPSCRLHQLQGSTLEANRYAPLSASMVCASFSDQNNTDNTALRVFARVSDVLIAP